MELGCYICGSEPLDDWESASQILLAPHPTRPFCETCFEEMKLFDRIHVQDLLDEQEAARRESLLESAPARFFRYVSIVAALEVSKKLPNRQLGVVTSFPSVTSLIQQPIVCWVGPDD